MADRSIADLLGASRVSGRAPTGGGGATNGFVFNPTTKSGKKPPGRGLFGQLVDSVKAFPTGMVKFGAETVQTIGMPVHVGLDIATGKYNLPSVKDIPGDYEAVMTGDMSKSRTLGDWAEEYLPAAYHMGVSAVGTGRRLNPATPWVGFQEYRKASNESRLVGTLIEDVGNVSMAAGGVAGVAGKAGAPLEYGLATAERGALRKSITEGVARGAVPEAGQMARLAELTAEARLARPRGLAGMLSKRGATEAAARVEAVGRGARRVSTLGERAANVPAAPFTPFRTTSRLAGVAERVANKLGATETAGRAASVGQAAERVGSLVRQAPGRALTKAPGVAQWIEARQAWSAVEREQQAMELEAQQTAIDPLKRARAAGLTDEQMSAGMLALTQESAGFDRALAQEERLRKQIATEEQAILTDPSRQTTLDYLNRQLATLVEQNDVAISGKYRDVDPQQRTTPQMVRDAYVLRTQGTADPALQAWMDELVQYESQVRRPRYEGESPTESQLAQSGQEPIPAVVGKARGRLERERNIAQTRAEREFRVANRQERINNVQQALLAELPKPPTLGEVKRLDASRRSAAAYAARKAKSATDAAAVLQQRLDEYMALEETSPDLQAAADRLDKERARYEGLVAEYQRTLERAGITETVLARPAEEAPRPGVERAVEPPPTVVRPTGAGRSLADVLSRERPEAAGRAARRSTVQKAPTPENLRAAADRVAGRPPSARRVPGAAVKGARARAEQRGGVRGLGTRRYSEQGGRTVDIDNTDPQVRAAATETARRVGQGMDFPGSPSSLLGPPLKGKGVQRYDAGGEYDWFTELSKEEQARLRKNGWVTSRRAGGNEMAGMAADQFAHALGEHLGRELDVDEAMGIWLDQTRKVDLARQLSKQPKGAAGRYRPNPIAHGQVDRASLADFMRRELFPDVDVRSAADQIRDVLTRSSRGPGRVPWRMGRAQYVADLTAAYEALPDVQTEWGVLTPEQEAAARRFDQLVPAEYADLLDDGPEAVWEAIKRDVAEVGDPERGFKARVRTKVSEENRPAPLPKPRAQRLAEAEAEAADYFAANADQAQALGNEGFGSITQEGGDLFTEQANVRRQRAVEAGERVAAIRAETGPERIAGDVRFRRAQRRAAAAEQAALVERLPELEADRAALDDGVTRALALDPEDATGIRDLARELKIQGAGGDLDKLLGFIGKRMERLDEQIGSVRPGATLAAAADVTPEQASAAGRAMAQRRWRGGAARSTVGRRRVPLTGREQAPAVAATPGEAGGGGTGAPPPPGRGIPEAAVRTRAQRLVGSARARMEAGKQSVKAADRAVEVAVRSQEATQRRAARLLGLADDAARQALEEADRAAATAASAETYMAATAKQQKEAQRSVQPTTLPGGETVPGRQQATHFRAGQQQARTDAAKSRWAAAARRVEKLNEQIGELPAKLKEAVQVQMQDSVKRTARRMSGVARRVLGDYGLREFGGLQVVKDPAGQGEIGVFSGQMARSLYNDRGLTQAMHEELMYTLRRMKDEAEDNGEVLGALDQLDAIVEITAGALKDETYEALTRSAKVADVMDRINRLHADMIGDGTWLDLPRQASALFDQLDDFIPADRVNELRKLEAQWARKRTAALTRFTTDLEAMPARYRTVEQGTRRMMRSLIDQAEELIAKGDVPSAERLFRLAAEAPSGLTKMVDAGIDPTHLLGGEAVQRVPARGGGQRRASRRAPRAHKMRETGLGPTSPERYIVTEADEAVRHVRDQVRKRLPELIGDMAQRADKVLAEKIAEYKKETGDTTVPATVMAREAREAGWAALEEGPITENTVLIPDALRKVMEKADAELAFYWRGLARANQAIKTQLLPFSARWYVGNLIGNAIMATVAGKLPLGQMVRDTAFLLRGTGMRPGKINARINDLMTSGTMDIGRVRAGRLATTGLTQAERKVTGMSDLGESEARTPIGRRVIEPVRRFGFNANEAVDNMYRSMVYMETLAKEYEGAARKQGVKVRDLTPDAKEALAHNAIEHTLRAMGDFTRLTPFERRKLRQVVMFYPWLKHATKLMLTLPIYSPQRAIFLGYLGEVFGEGDVPELLKGKVPFAGGFLDVRFLSPFEDPTMSPIVNPTETLRSVSPAIKVPVAGLTGIDLNKSRQTTRPPSTVSRGAYGQEKPVPLVTRPGELLGYTIGQIPVAKRTRDIIQPVARYGTGAPVRKKGKTVPTGTGRTGALASLLGIPAPTKIDVEREQREAEKARRGR